MTAEQVLEFVVTHPGCNSADVGSAFASGAKGAGAHLSRLAAKKLIIQRGTRNSYIYGPLGWTPRAKLKAPSSDTAEARIGEIDEMIRNLQRERRALVAYIEALKA